MIVVYQWVVLLHVPFFKLLAPEWIAINLLGASSVLHMLDDFLFIAESSEKCQLDLNNFLNKCQFLGVPIAEEKTVGPNMVLQFAGITLDSVLQ